MAATGNEFVLLRQLKLATDYIGNLLSALTTKISALVIEISTLKTSKLDAPASAGTDGQMLVYGADGNQWVDVPEGTAYSADNATLQLSGTQFSVKDLGITAAKIADGTITADKLASDVIPDVSGFITGAAADGKYAAKSHTHLASQVTGFPASMALMSSSTGYPMASEVTSTELGYLDGVTSAIQTQLDGKAATDHTHSAATTSAAGFMSAADKAKLDALPSSFTDPAVDIVRTTTHSTSYTKDTLEIVTDSTGKVTEMWFVTAD